jgi:uncharacterized protein with PIN domain
VIYLDTSCLLKLLLEEPESGAVRLAVAREAEVIVSALTELETTVQLRAGWLSGPTRGTGRTTGASRGRRTR